MSERHPTGRYRGLTISPARTPPHTPRSVASATPRSITPQRLDPALRSSSSSIPTVSPRRVFTPPTTPQLARRRPPEAATISCSSLSPRDAPLDPRGGTSPPCTPQSIYSYSAISELPLKRVASVVTPPLAPLPPPPPVPPSGYRILSTLKAALSPFTRIAAVALTPPTASTRIGTAESTESATSSRLPFEALQGLPVVGVKELRETEGKKVVFQGVVKETVPGGIAQVQVMDIDGETLMVDYDQVASHFQDLRLGAVLVVLSPRLVPTRYAPAIQLTPDTLAGVVHCNQRHMEKISAAKEERSKGNRLYRIGDHDEALQHYGNTLDHVHDKAEELLARPLSYDDKSVPVTPEALSDRLVEREVRDICIFTGLNMAAAFLALGRPVEAMECADRVLLFDPNCLKAHYRRGRALADMGEYDAAAVAYDIAEELAPGDIGIVRARFALHRKAGKPIS